MNKLFKHLLLALISIGLVGAASFLVSPKTSSVQADTTETYPRNGQSGVIMYVNGQSTYFNSGEADLAVCCWNNSGSAWTERLTYRCFGDMIRVMLPYKNGASQTWSYFKICRYNPSLDPQTSGDAGVYNETDSIPFSIFIQAQNTITINGYNGDKLTYAEMRSVTNYYGVKAENHMYLDLSGFTDWEQKNAKFALYFACPSSTNETRWGQAYSTGGYYSSFCWKVEGQDNDHLYECIVPNLYSGNSFNLWNLVIAVRFDPVASEPGWSNVWNQTQNLSFNSSNHTGNMIHIDGWNHGEFDVTNSISQETRIGFYGSYFLDTVVCSGSGNSDATTSSMWNSVKVAYENHLSRVFQGVVWTTEASETGSQIAKAMARYDYIVLYKQYNHEDFINRQESPNKTTYQAVTVTGEPLDDGVGVILVVVVCLLSITAIATIIILKAKKRPH